MRTRLLVLVLAAALTSGASASAAPGDQTGAQAFLDAVTPGGIMEHAQAFQDIADANAGTRASGTPGYDASAQYVVDQLTAAGYSPQLQAFDFPYFQELSPAVLEQVAPGTAAYETGTFTYSGSGDVTAPATLVDVQIPPGPVAGSSTSGCEAADFAGFTPGNIAVVQRGGCFFVVKAMNAEAAGASAVVIFNEGQPGRTDVVVGTLGGPGITIPVVGASFATGEELNGLVGLVLHVRAETISEIRTTENVIAETFGSRENVVVVGAHLDSVAAGPGINDNGSGSSTILEIALQMSGTKTRNAVRFIWFGAEELGLLGSEHYVGQLTPAELDDIALNLNFDMVGSPNFARFVYDGDNSAFPEATDGPPGSGAIERVFVEYFTSRGLASEPTAFDGRSDYGPFIDAGIPAGGLFTGAEGIKTVEQVALYGGTAGIAYDPCYHEPCDTIANVNVTAIDQMSDAAAYAVYTFARSTTGVNGVGVKTPPAAKAASGSRGPLAAS